MKACPRVVPHRVSLLGDLCFNRVCLRNLLEFVKHPAHILRMQEKNRIAVRADLGRAIAENTDAFFDKVVARRQNIRHLEAEMMRATPGLRSRKAAIGEFSPSG